MSPVRLPYVEEEFGLFTDRDRETDVCIDWRKEIREALPGEGSELYHAHLQCKTVICREV